MRFVRTLLTAAILTTSGACSEPAAIDTAPEELGVIDQRATSQQIAQQIESDFTRLCLSGATSAEGVFVLARDLGWETFGVPEEMADMDRPWPLRTAVKVSDAPAGPVCAVEHSAGDAREVMPILWRSIGATVPTEEELRDHPFRICRAGALEGRDVEGCSFDFTPHGIASGLSTTLARPSLP